MNKIKELSNLLIGSRSNGTTIPNVSKNFTLFNKQEAYGVQVYNESGLDPRVGWKIAATSKSGQRHIGVSGPIIGRITSSMLLKIDELVSPKSNRMMVVEPEFVFVFNSAIVPRNDPFTREEVLGYIKNLKLGLEFPNSRYSHFETAGELNLIADNACAHQFMLGPTVSELWREIALFEHIVKVQIGTQPHYEGKGSNVLGDPVNALLWFVNEASKQKFVINSGDFVTTGTLTNPVPFLSGDEIRVNFGELGEMACRIDND